MGSDPLNSLPCCAPRRAVQALSPPLAPPPDPLASPAAVGLDARGRGPGELEHQAASGFGHEKPSSQNGASMSDRLAT